MFLADVRTGEVKYPCAGSIINNRIILTAAHCALAKADGYKLLVIIIISNYVKYELIINLCLKILREDWRMAHKLRYRLRGGILWFACAGYPY